MDNITSKIERNKMGIDNYITWFEIPAIDFKQAVQFYNYIFEIEMEERISDTNSMAFFPAQKGIGGAIVTGPGYVPSDSGPLIYLNAGNNLNGILSKVEKAGGRIVLPKTLINEDSGYFGIFIDSQGNKLALYSKS